MLKTIEIIKEQIKILKQQQRPTPSPEVLELQELIEFIHYDHEILENENQKLLFQIQKNPLNIRLQALTDALTQEQLKSAKLVKKLETLEKMLFNTNKKSLNEPGSLTERKLTSAAVKTQCKSPNKSIQNLARKSPIKPPRVEKSLKSGGFVSSETVKIKNDLAKAIEKAHRTLATSKTGPGRSISPCFSTSSSRYSSPSRKGVFNTSLE